MKRKQERGEKCLFLFLRYSCILKEVPVFGGKENRQQTGTKIRKCVYSIRIYRNMKWNRFTLKTKTEAEDIVICTLAEVGIEGVEIQDKQPLTDEDKAHKNVDIMPELLS